MWCHFWKVTSYPFPVLSFSCQGHFDHRLLRAEPVSHHVFAHNLAMQASVWIRASNYYHCINSCSQRNKNQTQKLRGDEKHTWFPGDSFCTILNTLFYFALKGQVTRGALQRRVRMPVWRSNQMKNSGQVFRDWAAFLPFFSLLSTASLSKYLSLPVINRH